MHKIGKVRLFNSFNRVGLDHVLLVRVASTAVVTHMLGGTRQQVIDAVSNAWIDGGALRTYRHAPNTGSRKSWAAGDATSRAVRLALIAMTGEMGYPSALSAKTWGYYDVLFKGKPFRFQRGYGSYVMENVLFKISYPAEFHSQTAVEAAMTLHADVKDRIDDVDKIVIETQEAGVRIIDKTGPLDNPADRDHCIQYMVAVPLIFGRLTAADYEDGVARMPRFEVTVSTYGVDGHKGGDTASVPGDVGATRRSLNLGVRVGEIDASQYFIEQPVGGRALERCEPFNDWVVVGHRASSSIMVRSRARPRRTSERVVLSGLPVDAAISACGRPTTWCRTTAVR